MKLLRSTICPAPKNQKKKKETNRLIPAGLEPATSPVLRGCDNPYTKGSPVYLLCGDLQSGDFFLWLLSGCRRASLISLPTSDLK